MSRSFRTQECLLQLKILCIIGRSCHKYHFCHDKSFVATKHVVCRDKSMLAATKRLCLSRQILKYFKICKHKKSSRRVLSQQKLYLWHLPPVITMRRGYTCKRVAQGGTESSNLSRRLSPFLIGRMFLREPSWKYSAKLVGS